MIEKPIGTNLEEARAAEPRRARRCSTRPRSTGSTTTSARRRSRTCWRSGSPTACSSRSGTATTSTTSRSRPPRTSASARAPATTTRSGALRDLVQNHMLQLLDAAVHGAAGHVLGRRRARREGQGAARDPPADARGGAGDGGARRSTRPGTSEGEEVARLPRGGRASPTDSTTETYAALRLEVDNWRWAGVPIYLRTGKRLARKVTEIAVTLKPVPHLAFQAEGSRRRPAEPARS